VSLSGITAPKLPRGRNSSIEEEPFAWESREFLRKKCIGQKVAFTVITKADSGREFVTMTLNGENIAHEILRAGYAKVSERKGDSSARIPAERQEMLTLQEDAEKAGLGMFRGGLKNVIRLVKWEPDSRTLFQSFRNKPLAAVVDSVRDGSTVRVELLSTDGTLTHQIITLHLAGVQCPRCPASLEVRKRLYEQKKAQNPDADIKEPKAEATEPFGDEARQFTELRLLNRDVDVVIQGMDKFGNFFGTLQFPKGNIAAKLLEHGLGKFVPWSAAITADRDVLYAAERLAKINRRRLHQSYDPLRDAQENPTTREILGTVIQVISGDHFVLRTEDGAEHKLMIASIRCPKINRRDTPEPFAWEARELIRSKLIGKSVKCVVEYTRELKSNDKHTKTTQPFVSVLAGKVNVAEMLVVRGLAEVLRHTPSEPRAVNYDVLLAAEDKARNTKQGMHDPKRQTATRIVDLTERKPSAKKEITLKCQSFQNSFARATFVDGVVEHVFNGSRMKIYVPSHNCMISFALGGVRCPQPTRKVAATVAVEANDNDEEIATAPQPSPSSNAADEAPDAVYGDEALAYVRKLCFQQDVKFDIEALDGGNNFIGNLYINGGKTNLALDLLQQGLAETFGASAQRSKFSNELFAIEAIAKENKTGLWATWVPPTPKEGESKDGDAEGQFINMRITEIVDTSNFYVHVVGNPAIEIIENGMQEFGAAVAESELEAKFVPLKRSICAGRFEDQWCRVRVESVNKEGNEFTVTFIDYGNADILPLSDLRPLPEALSALPPLARSCALAGVKAPPETSEFADQAAEEFNLLVSGDHALLGKIEFIDHGRLHLTVHDEKSPISINQQLVRDGWVKVLPRPPRKLAALCASLKADQESAKSLRQNAWAYGEFPDPEEDELANDNRPRGAGRGKGRK